MPASENQGRLRSRSSIIEHVTLVTRSVGRVPFISFHVTMMIKTIFAPLYYALEQQVSQSLRVQNWTTCSSIDYVCAGTSAAVEPTVGSSILWLHNTGGWLMYS
jgi:hypothetical protein